MRPTFRPTCEQLETRCNPAPIAISPTPILPWAFAGGPTVTAGFAAMPNGDIGVTVVMQNGTQQTADLDIPNAASYQAIQIGGSSVLPDQERVPAANPLRLTWNAGANPHVITAYELDVWFSGQELSSFDGGLTWQAYTPPMPQQAASLATPASPQTSVRTSGVVAVVVSQQPVGHEVDEQHQQAAADPKEDVHVRIVAGDFAAGLALAMFDAVPPVW